MLAAGAVGTPVILQRSDYPDRDDVVGRGVVLHPSLPVGGIFDRRLQNYRNITGTFYSDAFRRSHGFVLECLFDHPMDTALAVPSFGRAHFDVMRDYQKLAGFGVMLIDDANRENRVRWDAAAGAPAIRYALGERDKERLRFGARTAVEIMLAAGAHTAFLTSDERLNRPEGAVFAIRTKRPRARDSRFARTPRCSRPRTSRRRRRWAPTRAAASRTPAARPTTSATSSCAMRRASRRRAARTRCSRS